MAATAVATGDTPAAADLTESRHWLAMMLQITQPLSGANRIWKSSSRNRSNLSFGAVPAVVRLVAAGGYASAPQPFNYCLAVVMQYSGVLAIGAMSVALLLATRPALAGAAPARLDKMYRLHKWLGISALALSVCIGGGRRARAGWWAGAGW